MHHLWLSGSQNSMSRPTLRNLGPRERGHCFIVIFLLIFWSLNQNKHHTGWYHYSSHNPFLRSCLQVEHRIQRNLRSWHFLKSQDLCPHCRCVFRICEPIIAPGEHGTGERYWSHSNRATQFDTSIRLFKLQSPYQFPNTPFLFLIPRS